MPGAVRFTQSGATVRTTNDVVSGDYTMQRTDIGVNLTQDGATCQMMPYADYQQGKIYFISNDSAGMVNAKPVEGEFFCIGGQLLSSVQIPPGETRQLLRETTNLHWKIV